MGGGNVGKEISLINESGVKKRIPFKSKYKGNPFIFICAERQTDRQTDKHTDRQTDRQTPSTV